MSEYNIYPSVDEDLNFPVPVRRALAAAPEFKDPLDLKAPLASPKFTGTPTGLVKGHVGLGNVDNTSDANKPVSTAQAAAMVPRWKAATAYTVGTQVVAPAPVNAVVSCSVAHTSSTAFATDLVSKWNAPVLSGTTTERNAMFGTLTTVAQQVALANKMVSFYNSTEGWWESYYSPPGTGLTAKALIGGNPAGWYPDGGSDLRAFRGQQNAFQTITANVDMEPTLGELLINTKGRFVKQNASGIQVPIGGYYTIHANGYYSGAVSAVVVTGIKFDTGGVIARGAIDKPNSNDFDVDASLVDYPLTKDTIVRLNTWSISTVSSWGTTGYNGSRLAVRYTGPPIAN